MVCCIQAKYIKLKGTQDVLFISTAHVSLLDIDIFVYVCVPLDCEVESTSAAAGGRKQRTVQARGVPVFCYCGILAY